MKYLVILMSLLLTAWGPSNSTTFSHVSGTIFKSTPSTPPPPPPGQGYKYFLQNSDSNKKYFWEKPSANAPYIIAWCKWIVVRNGQTVCDAMDLTTTVYGTAQQCDVMKNVNPRIERDGKAGYGRFCIAPDGTMLFADNFIYPEAK